MTAYAALHFLAALVFAPLLPGIINRVKAAFAGRRGRPLLQLYFDLAKLARKGAVYSATTTWVIGLGPSLGLACALAALLVLPCGNVPALVAFPGDLLFFAGSLGLARYAVIASAMDTGSSFEGMGSSREAAFGAVAEPALILALLVFARASGDVSLSGMFTGTTGLPAPLAAPAVILSGAGLFILLLAENCRIPVDDPNTHLELTMIHEVMVLDHSGPDFGLIQYAASLKLWIFAGLFADAVAPPLFSSLALSQGVWFATVLATAASVGVVESCMARLKLTRVPQLLTAAGALAALALMLPWR